MKRFQLFSLASAMLLASAEVSLPAHQIQKILWTEDQVWQDRW